MKLSTASAFLALRFLSEQHLHQATATGITDALGSAKTEQDYKGEEFYAKGKYAKDNDVKGEGVIGKYYEDFVSEKGHKDKYAKDNDAKGEGVIGKYHDDFMSEQGHTDKYAKDNDAKGKGVIGKSYDDFVSEQDQTSAAGTTDAGLRGTRRSVGTPFKKIKRKKKCILDGVVHVRKECAYLCETTEQLEKAGCINYK